MNETMADTGAIVNILHAIGERISDDMSEQDVQNAFLNENFFETLDYEGAGFDLRSEFSLPDHRRPDYVTLDPNESVTAIYEFKKPSRDLPPHESQLAHYTTELKADYGVLTNGVSFRLYRRTRDGLDLETIVDLDAATEADVRTLIGALEKPVWDITDPESVDEFLSGLDHVSLDGELGREHFFDTFRLEEGSPFADLVTAAMDLLHELRDEEDAKFVTGAFDFWEASYADQPDQVPDSWDPFLDGNEDLNDFMFCLETGHALLARLLLAKACDDFEFLPQKLGFHRYFEGLEGFGGINLEAYPVAANGLIQDMRENLVESLFEDDIFIWWIDGYTEQLGRGHETFARQFQKVAEEEEGVTRISKPVQERFSRAVAHVLFSVLKFNFSRIAGDPLGNLYQRYFDPETRKALGEFYTPQEVVEYIMDGVDYKTGISNERLIDPACGSGTFLVEAVNRYLADVRRFNDDPDWERHLTDLCTRPHIVGLDIHPFAVLMAQIRFMVAILPEYKEAKEENPEFTIRRLPIYRTDSLHNERESTGINLGDDVGKQLTFDALTEDSQDVFIPVPLPIEVAPNGTGTEAQDGDVETQGDFLVQRVRMPLFDTIQLETGVRNFGEYFAALQGVLDVVKRHMQEGLWKYHGGLERGIHRYTTREYEGIDEFFAPYVEDILETVEYLREDHGDGRLFKMFEDTILALVVKNYMDYEYVVGNPPYVNIKKQTTHQKEYLKSLYGSAVGQFDLYCPFYERGLNWLTPNSGRLGFITPNQFMTTRYASDLREIVLSSTVVEEVYDFRDSGVFEDATNYPAIVVLRDEQDEAVRSSNDIRCVRVKSNVKDHSGRELDEEIVDSVREQRTNPGYSDDFIDVFDFPQEQLSRDFWALMPPPELAVFKKLERKGDKKVGDVTDSVFHATSTSANGIYVVEVLDAGRINPDDKGGIVTVVPTGGSKQFEVETDLLRPFLMGDDIERWNANWSGLHLLHPYMVEKNDDSVITAELCSREYLQERLPLTWEFFVAHKDELEARERGRKRGDEDWYAYIYDKNLTKFENPKIIQAHVAEEATYMADPKGVWYFTTAYGVLLKEEYRDITNEVLCQLNSKPLDFYFKNIANIKAGGYYEYIAQYVEKVPCVTKEQESLFPFLREKLNSIISTIDLKSKTDRFPSAYLGEFSGELEYIDYKWQTRRYPVNAEIQTRTDGTFAIKAGRSDSITDPRMDSEERAQYVHAAVDGRNVKSGMEMSIPIPSRDKDVEARLAEWQNDRAKVEEIDIKDLEAEIDSAVYDLFDLSDDEREVLEEYLDVF